MQKDFRKKPPRLPFIFESYTEPLYFVTFCTWKRQKLLNTQPVFKAVVAYAEKNMEHGRAIGKFVIMPDHLHLFIRLSPESKLSAFIRLLKQEMGRVIDAGSTQGKIWQPGFFDHLLRSDESYAEKWNYVNMNPVRAGLVGNPEDWPWSGEIVRIDRHS